MTVALPSLRRRSISTGAAILCLALGTGSVTAVFAVVDRTLVRPTSYQDPAHLVQVYERFGQGGVGTVAPATFRDWELAMRGTLDLGAYTVDQEAFEGASARSIAVTLLTPSVFGMVRVTPLLGRYLAPRDTEVSVPVAVVSESFWRSSLDGNASAVGQVIRLSGRTYTVVGVMPSTFALPARQPTDVWIPLTLSPTQWADRDKHDLFVLGRLNPSITIASAQAALDQTARRLNAQLPGADQSRGAIMFTLTDDLTRSLRPAVLLMLAAAWLVLVIACANVAIIFLAQARERERETAVRAALGASPARLTRGLITRGLALGLSGGLSGLLMAGVSLRALRPLSEHVTGLRIDAVHPAVIAFLLAVSAAIGLGLGVLPAWRAWRANLRVAFGAEGNRLAGATTPNEWLRGTLLTVETGLAFALLASAGLLLNTVRQLLAVPSGMATNNVLTMHVGASPQRSGGDAVQRFYLPMLARVQAIPGVAHAGLISMLPLQSSGNNSDFTIEPAPRAAHQSSPLAELRLVTPDYYAALGIHQVDGRSLSASGDVNGAPPVLEVNQALVRQIMGNENPTGRRIAIPAMYTGSVAGVVSDVHQISLDSDPFPEIDIPLSQIALPDYVTSMSLVVRSTVPIAQILPDIRLAVRSIDPTQPVSDIETMEDVLSTSLVDRHFLLVVLGSFASVALVLASAGLFGVVHYIVSQRSREIALRIALGARAPQVIGFVLGRIAMWTSLGLAGGVALAQVFARLLANAFYVDGSTNWTLYVAVGALMPAIAMLASFIPTRRAVTLSPANVLRDV